MITKSGLTVFVIFILSNSFSIGQESIEFFNSPNERHSVVSKATEIGDANVEYDFLLINRSSGDSTYLYKTVCHDMPAPNFFWIADNMLLYELRNESEGTSFICIRDIEKNDEIFRTKGMIPLPRKQAENFLDRANSVLVFFRIDPSTSINNFELSELDLISCTTQTIAQLSIVNHLEYPTVQLDTEKRQLQLEYIDSINAKRAILSFNY